MSGAVMNPVNISVSQNPSPSPSASYFNSRRISAAVDRLLAHVSGSSKNDSNEFSHLCLSLSRGIDYAVGSNEIPDRASELPRLLKQVCQWTHDSLLRASIMVLMISIKGASKNGWFSEKNNDELNILWKEIANSFRSVRDMNSGESTFHQSISEVMSRFYPRMKLGEILTFVEATPGYGAYVEDFHITMNVKSPQEKIYLFVVQTENTDTAACIISPQQVTFLLNGKGVDGRTCIYKDPGPQIPTMVENIVKYGGSNLLQAIGNFNGKYIIVVAFMSMVSNPSYPTLPDYVSPVAAATNSDNEIIEGPSRISLNCPISFKRIKTPVKGHLCNHLQCFDFDNYVDINSRRPLWRCPHCSQSVCFSDIRIDQGMVKVLKEVGENVSHVKFSGSSSWEIVIEGDNHADKPHDKSLLHQDTSISRDPSADILDLTIEDKEMDANNSRQENDKKPTPAQLQNAITNAISQGQSQLFSSNNMQLPTHASGTSNTRSTVAISQGQTHINAFNSIQSQQHNSNNMSNEYVGRYPTPARFVTRIPIAVQALPAQTLLGIVSSDRQQQFSSSQIDQHPLMHMVSAPPSQNTASQNWVHHDRLNVASQLVPQFGAYPDPAQPSSGYSFNSHQQQSFNQMMQNSSQSLSPRFRQGVVGPTTGLVSDQLGYHYPMATDQQDIQNSSWTQHVTTPLQTSASSVQTMRMAVLEEQQRGRDTLRGLEVSADAPVDPYWQSVGRMRGSLSGQAYSDAINQYIAPPIQPIHATRPPVLNTIRPVIPPHLQDLLGNNRNGSGYQDVANSMVLDGAGAKVWPGN